MKQITKYQCETCLKVYDTAAEATDCEAKGTVQPKAKVGDKVYVPVRYPDNHEKPFCERTITKVLTENRHMPQYVFDKDAQIGRNHFIGREIDGFWEGDKESDWATQNDFYLLGEDLIYTGTKFNYQPMSLDFVDLKA